MTLLIIFVYMLYTIAMALYLYNVATQSYSSNLIENLEDEQQQV